MMAAFCLEERLAWRPWVTPKLLHTKPVHRWYVFPHSFTSELVQALIDEWRLGPEDRILDPFVGAGTTVVAAKERGIPACGYDLSPLALLATGTKVADLRESRLRDAWRALEGALSPARWNGPAKAYPDLVRNALPGGLLGAFDAIALEIDRLSCAGAERDFFRLALLRTIPEYSRAVATGGWLKWVHNSRDASTIPATLAAQVEVMLADLDDERPSGQLSWLVEEGDARRLPDEAEAYTAVITSPPYPNRHDYTRVFGVELMFGFLDWEETRRLRYQSFHSHPESRPERPDASRYTRPQELVESLGKVARSAVDRRVLTMLDGYFVDMYLCLREMARVCRSGARIALVVGNAQYCGEPILVDELTAEIGEQAGLACQRILVARYRSNSAQQMGKHGRCPSRESVVVFRKPFPNSDAPSVGGRKPGE